MKIGILSDSHDNMQMIAAAVALFNREGVSHVLHAGDIVAPFTFKEFDKLTAPLWAVFGNNDGERHLLRERIQGRGEFAEQNFEKEWEGKRLIVMHEPRFLETLRDSGKYDIIIYGHTHQPDIQRGRCLIVNPGETGGWLTGKCTAAILTLPQCVVKILPLKGPGQK